jgi:hypothetical protein
MSVIFPPYSGGGGGGAVDSVNGATGAVVLDANDVGAVEQSGLSSRVYATTSGGAETTVVYATTAAANSIALRGAGGTLDVGTPQSSTDAVPRAYLETVLEDYVRSDGTVTDLVSKTEAEMSGITPDATTVYAVTP